MDGITYARAVTDPSAPMTVMQAAETLGLTVMRVRTLISSGMLESALVGRRRYVPHAAIAAYNKARRATEASRRAKAPLDWDWEGNLVARLADWFTRHGWREVSRADAALREHGIDLVVEKDGRTKVIEVKGWPTERHSSGIKAGQPKKYRQTIARSYFGDLMLAAMLLRVDRPDDDIAVAVPDRTTFVALIERVGPLLASLRIEAYVIDAQGGVSELSLAKWLGRLDSPTEGEGSIYLARRVLRA